MNEVISVENLSKKYIIRHQQRDSYVALRDVIAENAVKMVRSAKNIFKPAESTFAKKEEFWALRDVTFSLNQGDRLAFSNGIIVLSLIAGALVYVFDAEV